MRFASLLKAIIIIIIETKLVKCNKVQIFLFKFQFQFLIIILVIIIINKTNILAL